MSQLINRQEMAMRYLLGSLPEDERTRLEQQFFSDDQVFEELEIAEDELIDGYVRAELSTDDKQQFEKLLVSPRLAERVELARILAKKVSQSSPQPQVITEPGEISKPQMDQRKVPWWKNLFGFVTLSPLHRAVFASSLALMVLASVAVFFVWTRLRAESQRLAAEQQQLEKLRERIKEEIGRNDELEGSLKRTEQEKEEQLRLLKDYQEKLEEARRSTVGLVLPYFLGPSSGTRGVGGRTKPIELRQGVSAYDLYLDVSGGGEYSRYNARVEDLNRKPISRYPSLKPEPRQGGNYIRCRVAAKDLSPGSYIVHVDGITESNEPENFNDYLFSVVAR